VDGEDGVGEVGGPAIGQVVPVHAGEHDEAQVERRHPLGGFPGLLGIQGPGLAALDAAEAAGAGADLPHEEEGGRSLGEAVGAIGATGLLADRVEMRVAQALLHAAQVTELHALLGDPRRKAGVARQHLATHALRETGHPAS